MHAHLTLPPAVHYPLQPDRALALWLALAWLAIGGVLLGWRMAQAYDAWRFQGVWWLAVVCWLAAAAWLWRWWHRLPHGWLVWTGQVWHVQAHGHVGDTAQAASSSCQVALDVQRALLLRLRPAAEAQAAPRWCWLHRTTAPAQWHALRCAVWATATTPAPHVPPAGTAGTAGTARTEHRAHTGGQA